MIPRCAGRPIRPVDAIRAPGPHAVHAQRRRVPARHLPVARRHHRRSSRPSYENWASASSCSATRSRSLRAGRPLTGRNLPQEDRGHVSSRSTTTAATAWTAAIEHHRKGTRCASKFFREDEASSRRNASKQRTRFDIEMMQRPATAPGIENYSRYLRDAASRRAAADAGRLPAGDVADVRRRVARHDAAGRRHVSTGDRARKRTLVEYGFRLPSRDRQPAAEVRGVRPPDQPQTIFVPPRPPTTRRSTRGRFIPSRSDPPTGLIDPVIIRPRRTQVDDLMPEIREARRKRARAGHHADEAHGRKTDRLPERERHQGAATCTPISTRSSASRSSATCGWAVRRAGRHQPAARGPRHPRGVAGRILDADKEGFPARRALADPDHRPRRATSTMGDPTR